MAGVRLVPVARLFSACWVALLAVGHTGLEAGAPQSKTSSTNAAPAATPQVVLGKYCLTCHNQRLQTGKFTLDDVDAQRPAVRAEVWEKVVRKLRTRTMPPPGSPRPDEATYNSLATWL